jgi:hypothetical protein
MVGGGAEARIANERPAGVWQNTEETEEQEVAHTDAESPPSPLTLMTDQIVNSKVEIFQDFFLLDEHLYFDQMA